MRDILTRRVFTTALVAVATLLLTVACETTPHQSPAETARNLSGLRVGDKVDLVYRWKDSDGMQTRCVLKAKDENGIVCGRKRIATNDVEFIRRHSTLRSGAATVGFIAISPILITGWIGACLATACDSGDNSAGSSLTCPLHDQDVQDLARKTKIVSVTASTGTSAGYMSDGDRTTLELVSLPAGDSEPSRVADDGEVVFLQPQTRDEEKQRLIARAFYIKAVLSRGLQQQCNGPWTGSPAKAVPSP